MDETSAADATYTVLARRYRPQRFEDCLGQEHVAQALKNAIKAGRVAHAYLFTGSRGVGKTSMARIFAKALNCANGPTPEPCGTCVHCTAIAAGSDLDVIEIDAASNTGVDDVRTLRGNIDLRPSSGRYKVYIVDEVHMLSTSAFNALLKTLEEPPPHAKFVFATTEPQKIPITILSRCQRFDFASADNATIVRRLTEICQAEGVEAETEALELVARRAGGSMRDSQSLLDQLLSFGGGAIQADAVHQMLGTAGDERVLALVDAALDGDAGPALTQVDGAAEAGVQLGELVEQLLQVFRDLLVLAHQPDAKLLSMPERRRGALAERARKRPPTTLLEMMDLLAACRLRMRSSTFGRTLLEMTLVRLCRLDEFLDLSAALADPPAAAKKNGRDEPAPATSRPAPVAPPRTPIPMPSSQTSTGQQPRPAAQTNGRSNGHVPAPQPTPGMELTAESAAAFWQTVRRGVGDMVLGAMLGKVESATLADGRLTLTFPAAYAAAKTFCETAERTAQLERLCAQVAGRPVPLAFRAAGGPSPVQARPSPVRLRDDAAKLPIVQQIQELLDGKVLQVDRTDPPADPADAAEPAANPSEPDDPLSEENE